VILLILAAAAYQILAIFACLSHLKRRDPFGPGIPAISILKPIYGADHAFYDAIRSHALIDAPRFEILFGVHSLGDPAVQHIERLRKEFPQVDIRLIESHSSVPNAKVGTLIDLAREAKYPALVINDSDIVVTADYLRRVAAPLADRRIGLVTCLYRASASSFPAKLEALGIATDFVPGALAARLTGVKEFGLGSTLALRADDLNRIGGFEALAAYIADDYQLGKRISQAGYAVYLSQLVVETHLGSGSWRDVWRHQVRWARTIRVSRPGGYLGLPITMATPWALVGAAAGWYWSAALLIALRLAAGLIAGVIVLRDPLTKSLWWLMPLRDLFGPVVWLVGLSGTTVVWRGKRMKLHRDGTLE
jgi:ceramide glucosyltransferase